MGHSGTPYNPDKETIRSLLIKHHGTIAKAAAEAGVMRHCFLKKVRLFPDMVELLNDLREDYEDALLDAAENSIVIALKNQNHDPANGLKAGMFVLNSKGKKRNWNNTFLEGNQNEDLKKAFEEVMQTVSKGQSRNLKNEDNHNIKDIKS